MNYSKPLQYLQEFGTLNGDIRWRVDKFFRRNMLVEERVLQAIEFISNNTENSKSLTFLRNAIIFYPAIACIIEEQLNSIGDFNLFSQKLLNVSTKQYSPTEDRKHIRRLLQGCFSDNNKRGLNNFGNSVRESGSLTIYDLIVGTIKRPISNQQLNPIIANAYKTQKDSNTGAEYWDWFPEIKNFKQIIESNFLELNKIENSIGEQQFLAYHDGKKVRLSPFGLWNATQYSNKSNELFHIQRNNVIQRNQLFSEESIEHLEFLINSNSKEHEFQMFFQKYPQYITTLGSYKQIHPQLILHEDSDNSKIPDFFIERFDNEFCDICELKRPTENLLKQTYNLTTFRDRVNIAIQQVLNYRDYFDDESNRRKFQKAHGLKAYKPRVILIMGRTHSFVEDIERIKLEDRISNSNIKLYTYDEIVLSARRWKRLTEQC